MSLNLNPIRTALVLIDLQRGIVDLPTTPHSAADVVRNAALLVAAARNAGVLVVLVRVAHPATDPARLQVETDAAPSLSSPEDGWGEPHESFIPQAGDLVIIKRQWGAFYGTELDQHLRRRSIDTLVLGGIATNFGVEATARTAYELGYQQLFAEDAMTSRGAGSHEFSVKTILPRLGRVRSTREIVAAMHAT